MPYTRIWQILCNASYIDIIIGIWTFVLRNCGYNFNIAWRQLLGKMTLLLTAAGVVIFLSQDNTKKTRSLLLMNAVISKFNKYIY